MEKSQILEPWGNYLLSYSLFYRGGGVIYKCLNYRASLGVTLQSYVDMLCTYHFAHIHDMWGAFPVLRSVYLKIMIVLSMYTISVSSTVRTNTKICQMISPEVLKSSFWEKSASLGEKSFLWGEIMKISSNYLWVWDVETLLQWFPNWDAFPPWVARLTSQVENVLSTVSHAKYKDSRSQAYTHQTPWYSTWPIKIATFEITAAIFSKRAQDHKTVWGRCLQIDGS